MHQGLVPGSQLSIRKQYQVCVCNVCVQYVFVPGCREHTGAELCFLRHSAHSSQLHRTTGARGAARFRVDRPADRHRPLCFSLLMLKVERSLCGWVCVSICYLVDLLPAIFVAVAELSVIIQQQFAAVRVSPHHRTVVQRSEPTAVFIVRRRSQIQQGLQSTRKKETKSSVFIWTQA